MSFLECSQKAQLFSVTFFFFTVSTPLWDNYKAEDKFLQVFFQQNKKKIIKKMLPVRILALIYPLAEREGASAFIWQRADMPPKPTRKGRKMLPFSITLPLPSSRMGVRGKKIWDRKVKKITFAETVRAV